MALLNKSAILGASDLPHEDVPVPAWGGSVRVRTLTGAERDEFREVIKDQNGVGRFSAALLAFTLIDEAGSRLFQIEEVEALLAKRASVLDVPATVAARINGLGADAVADAVKNSGSGQSDDSGSGLPKS